MRITTGLYHFDNRNPVIAPVGEHGWLTPVRATRGCPKTWIWTCRCGATVTREARSVRKAEREGRVAKCSPRCSGVKLERLGT